MLTIVERKNYFDNGKYSPQLSMINTTKNKEGYVQHLYNISLTNSTTLNATSYQDVIEM